MKSIMVGSNIKIDKNNIDDYYKKVNSAIDVYFGYAIDPNKLVKYLSPGTSGLANFKKRNELENVGGIDKVISDVLEDRVAGKETKEGERKSKIVSEDILSFIHFKKVNESNEDIPIRILALLTDRYDVSAGHISKVNDKEYTVERGVSGDDTVVMIFDDKDIEAIVSDIKDSLYNSLVNKELHYDKYNMDITLGSILDKEFFMKRIEKLIRAKLEFYISAYLTDENNDIYFFFVYKNDGYYIFQKK